MRTSQAQGCTTAASGQNRVRHTVYMVLRIVLAAYVLAQGTAIYLDPAMQAPFHGAFGLENTHNVAAVFLICSGAAIMFGVFVRYAALLLSAYVFWVGAGQLISGAPTSEQTAFWGLLGLIGAVLMISPSRPTGTLSFGFATKVLKLADSTRFNLMPATANRASKSTANVLK